MSDLISTQELVAKIVDTAIRKILSGEQKLTKEYEQSVIEAVDEILNTARRERGKAETQAEIVRCKDCKHVFRYRSEESAKKFGQIYECRRGVLNLPELNDFCSLAERRTNGSD